MTNSTPERATPPPARRERINWTSTVEHLSKHPGEWFLVSESASPSSASHLRRRHGIEVRTQGTANEVKIWAMYPEAEDEGATP